jgi:hypothetical protein
MAVSYGLHTSEKAESQDFIGDSNNSCLFVENESGDGYIVNSKYTVRTEQEGSSWEQGRALLLRRLLKAKAKEKMYGQE